MPSETDARELDSHADVLRDSMMTKTYGLAKTAQLDTTQPIKVLHVHQSHNVTSSTNTLEMLTTAMLVKHAHKDG